MYNQGNVNFIRFIWKNLALLILFCTFLCSASKLEQFENVFNSRNAHSSVFGITRFAAFHSRNLDQAIAECSDRCYSSKYFCDFFTIVELKDVRNTCYMYNTGASSLSYYKLPRGQMTKAAFRLYDPQHVEPLQERFSYDPKSSLEDWVGNLVTGYSLSSFITARDVLTASVKAINSKPATAIDFDKWVASRDVSQSRRKSFELQDSTGWKMMEAVKAWEQFTNGNKEASTEYFDILLLTFLDIFCPHLQPDITTIYDPVKNVIFITKSDIHILVVSYGNGDFAVVRSKDNFQWPEGDPMVYLSNFPGGTPGKPVELFQQATNKRFSNPFYDRIPAMRKYEPTDTLLTILDIVVYTLSDNYDFSKYHSLSGPLSIFYRDLITVVLSSVYKNERHPIHMTLKTMFTRGDFGDISISTIPKIE